MYKYRPSIIALCLILLLTRSVAMSQETPSDAFETISASNLDRLEPLGSWQPDGQLLTDKIAIAVAKNANVALIENRFQNLLGTIDLDQQHLGSTYHFNTDTVINRTAMSPNGQFAAVQDYTSFDVWATETGKTVLHGQVSEAQSEVNDLVFSPEPSTFATVINGYPNLSSEDGIYIYDLSTGLQTTKLEHPTVTTATFSPDGNHLTSAGYDGSIYLWDLQTNQATQIRQADQNKVFQLRYVNTDLLAVGVQNNNVNQNILEYWTISDKQRAQESDSRRYSEYLKLGVAQTPLNHYSTFQFWNVLTDKNLALLQNEFFLDCSVEQNLLVTQFFSGTSSIINFHELSTGKLLFTVNKSNFSSALLSLDGKKLILWGESGNIEIWGVRKQ